MRSHFRGWPARCRRLIPAPPPLGCERLEDRTLLNGQTLATALPVSFQPNHTAALTGSLDSPRAVRLSALALQAGDTVRVRLVERLA